jgi:hypothetical protein
MSLRIAVPFVVALLGACAASPSEPADDGTGGDEGSGSGSAADPGGDDDMLPPACQDDVPVADIVPMLENSAATIGDVARAPDGALYFITDMTSSGAKISRRLPCAQIEKDWLVTTTPVRHIEISTDNLLFMVANGTATNMRSRMWVVDLGIEADLPHLLFDQPGTVVQSMSAGTNGRVFFTGGDAATNVSLMYIDSSADPQIIETFAGSTGYVAASPDGGARFHYERLDAVYGWVHNIGTMHFNSNGTTVTSDENIVTGQPNDYEIRDIQSDALGGVYIKRVQGSVAGARTCTLYHAPNLLSTRSVVAELKNLSDCRIVYGIDGDATSAYVVAFGGTKLMTAVTLPTPLMM